MIREKVLREFSDWNYEQQLAEFNAYKRLGDYSPFSVTDYSLMESIMKNPNAEIECENGICEIKSQLDESSKITQEEADELIAQLEKIAKRHPDRVVDEDGKIYKDIIIALNHFEKDKYKFLKELLNSNVDYDVESKGLVFTVEFETSKRNIKELKQHGSQHGLRDAETAIINIDDDLHRIDKLSIDMAKALAKS